jgi:nitroreductase
MTDRASGGAASEDARTDRASGGAASEDARTDRASGGAASEDARTDRAPAGPAGEDARTLDPVAAAWRDRRSVRAFSPDPLPRERLAELFASAQAAPSWCNVQPWRVAVTEPPFTAELAQALLAAARSGLPAAEIPFPLEYPSPHKELRVACGKALYEAMGVARDDKAGRYEAWLRNYALFDAPHAAIVSCHRRLGPYAYVDVGVWLGYVLTAAALLGIDTCPMASIAAYPATLRKLLPIADTDVVLFGLVLGRADDAAPANACRTTREPVSANVTFVSGDRPA